MRIDKMGTLFPKGNLFPKNGLHPVNKQGNNTRKVGIEFEIDEKRLEKEIEKKIDTAVTRALKTINGK